MQTAAPGMTSSGSEEEVGRLYPTPSDDAADTWRRFAAQHGVSITAIIEALAPELERLAGQERLPVFWRQLIDEARAYDAENRSREKPD